MARKPPELRPVMTRIPEKLRKRLEAAAAGNGRSMNAEIIHRLEQSLDPKMAQSEMLEHLRGFVQEAFANQPAPLSEAKILERLVKAGKITGSDIFEIQNLEEVQS